MAFTMPNRYPGDCKGCGRAVPPGAGLAVKTNGSWHTEHLDCEEWAHEHPAPAALVKAVAAAPTGPTPDVAAGRYAVLDPVDGVLKFYKVDRPTEGRWKGYTFLKVYASDETWPIRDHTHRDLILTAIAADARGAMERYGAEIGKCGRCGRTLTDEASRARGIGPDCWSMLNEGRGTHGRNQAAVA